MTHQVNAYKTADGRLFENPRDAAEHEVQRSLATLLTDAGYRAGNADGMPVAEFVKRLLEHPRQLADALNSYIRQADPEVRGK